ncbi:hypothetical protein ABPG77_001116 [Micractinium sp. CCAP 211/92]
MASAALSPRGAAGASHRQSTVVTRERVIAPPERFITASDEQLVAYFKDAFGAELAPAVPVLQQLVESICTHDFSALRRRLQSDYEYFGAAAEARSDVRLKPQAELDLQEQRFLSDFVQLMDASQFRMLTQAEWDAAQAEDFLFTLPCDVKWSAMDEQMLRRYWAAYPEGREAAPKETAERILVFQRGAEVALMEGSYFNLKVNLLISFWILQPLYRIFVALMQALRITRFVPDAPKGLATVESEDPAAKAALEAAAASADLHEASTSIERRTFARVFPDGTSVLKQLLKKVKLQEACFRDVVVLYRKAVPDKPVPASEVDVVKEADPKFMQRNIVLKQFRGIPMADLEMVMPEKKVFVPPRVFVEMAVTLIGGLVAVVTGLMARESEKGGGLDMTAAYTSLSLLGGRAAQVYSSAYAQRNLIENTMSKMLFDRTVGSGATVLNSLVDSVCKQRMREIFVCYCVLLNSSKPLTAHELDAACERLLARQFACRIDFCCEEALPAILKWGLASEGGDGRLAAAPLPEALRRLDGVLDSLYDFRDAAKGFLQGASGVAAGAASGAAEAAGRAATAAGAALGRSLSAARKPLGTGPAPPASPRSPEGKQSRGVRGVFRRIGRAFS